MMRLHSAIMNLCSSAVLLLTVFNIEAASGSVLAGIAKDIQEAEYVAIVKIFPPLDCEIAIKGCSKERVVLDAMQSQQGVSLVCLASQNGNRLPIRHRRLPTESAVQYVREVCCCVARGGAVPVTFYLHHLSRTRDHFVLEDCIGSLQEVTLREIERYAPYCVSARDIESLLPSVQSSDDMRLLCVVMAVSCGDKRRTYALLERLVTQDPIGAIAAGASDGIWGAMMLCDSEATWTDIVEECKGDRFIARSPDGVFRAIEFGLKRKILVESRCVLLLEEIASDPLLVPYIIRVAERTRVSIKPSVVAQGVMSKAVERDRQLRSLVGVAVADYVSSMSDEAWTEEFWRLVSVRPDAESDLKQVIFRRTSSHHKPDVSNVEIHQSRFSACALRSEKLD